MKKISLSRFDLGFIIAFVVVTLLGFGGYWWLSGQLQDAQAADATAKAAYDKNSSNPKYHVAVSSANVKTLQSNIDLIKAQVNPLIPAKLQTKDNKLSSVDKDKEDPVAWKHDLDDTVHRLTAAAKTHGVTLPPNFYFGFARYLSQSPSDEQTGVLSKQLIAVDQIVSILLKAPVKSIQSVGRTYEEDPHTPGNPSFGGGAAGDTDHMPGFSFSGVANSYISYPFQVEFVTTAENFRPIVNDLIQSPYVFIIRIVSVTSSTPESPQLNDLDALAAGGGAQGGANPPGGAVATTQVPPQFLFGESTITVKMRIDLIEWKGVQP